MTSFYAVYTIILHTLTMRASWSRHRTACLVHSSGGSGAEAERDAKLGNLISIPPDLPFQSLPISPLPSPFNTSNISVLPLLDVEYYMSFDASFEASSRAYVFDDAFFFF